MATTVVILGSPRKNGNSAAIAQAVAEGAKSKGNTIKTFFLNEYKNLRGCQACYACKKSGRCVQKDDTLPIIDAIRDADSIVIATPTYFGLSTSQYRAVEDRYFSFMGADFVPNIAAGKKVVIIETCGGGLDGAKKNADAIEGVWKNFFKADIVGKIVVGYQKPVPCEAADDAKTLAEAKELGKKL